MNNKSYYKLMSQTHYYLCKWNEYTFLKCQKYSIITYKEKGKLPPKKKKKKILWKERHMIGTPFLGLNAYKARMGCGSS